MWGWGSGSVKSIFSIAVFMVGLRVKCMCGAGHSRGGLDFRAAVGLSQQTACLDTCSWGASCCSLCTSCNCQDDSSFVGGFFYLPYFPESPSWKFWGRGLCSPGTFTEQGTAVSLLTLKWALWYFTSPEYSRRVFFHVFWGMHLNARGIPISINLCVVSL